MDDTIEARARALLSRPVTRRDALKLGAHGVVLTGLGSLTASFLAACSANPSASGGATAAGASASAAPAGGSVSVITWESEHPKKALEAWSKATGITVNATYMSDSPDPLTKLQAGGLGQIDVVVAYNGFVDVMHGAGVLQPIDTSRLKNYGQLFKQFQHAPWQMFDGKDWGVPQSWGGFPLVYDGDAINNPPASWLDLKKPEYKDKIVMVDDAIGHVLIFGKALGFDPPNRITREQLDQIIEWLIELKKTNARAVALGGELADLLARHEAAIVYGQGEEVLVNARAKGVNAMLGAPREGGFSWVDSYCIAKDAPNLDAAYAFIDAAIGEDARLETATTYGTANEKAAARLPAEMQRVWAYDKLDALAQYGAFPEDSSGGFVSLDDVQKAWERFKAA